MATLTKTKPKTMGVRDYARRRRCAPSTVEEAIESGRLSRSIERDAKGRPRINPVLADAEWSANTDASLNPKASERGTFAAARARREFAEAETKELKLRQLRDELVERSEVKRHLVDVFSKCRTKLLGIPSRVKQQLPHLTSVDVGTIEALVREALEDLATKGAGE